MIRYRKVGGLHFLWIGRAVFSFCWRKPTITVRDYVPTLHECHNARGGTRCDVCFAPLQRYSPMVDDVVVPERQLAGIGKFEPRDLVGIAVTEPVTTLNPPLRVVKRGFNDAT